MSSTKLTNVTRPRAQKRVIKTISKGYRAELQERGFDEYTTTPGSLEVRSFEFRKNATKVFIYEYADSLTFVAINGKQEAILEIWSDKYDKKRPFGGCAVTILMEKMYKIAFEILHPQNG